MASAPLRGSGLLKWCVPVEADTALGVGDAGGDADGGVGESNPVVGCSTWEDMKELQLQGKAVQLRWPLAGIALHVPMFEDPVVTAAAFASGNGCGTLTRV